MNDGIIEGVPLRVHNDSCHACGGEVGVIVRIQSISLPEGIRPGRTMIAFKDEKDHHKQLGIECGCYARFHRQVAHIQGRMRK
jgi:hypothetical protein